MNEEEKKAFEYSKNCLMKITLGINCEFDVNILDTLLNIIKKLQKENEELKADNYELNNRINDLLDNIPVQKVKDKIEELNRKIDKSIDNSKGGLDEEFIEKAGELLIQKRILQELLEWRK